MIKNPEEQRVEQRYDEDRGSGGGGGASAGEIHREEQKGQKEDPKKPNDNFESGKLPEGYDD